MKIAVINNLTPEHPAWKYGKRLSVKIFTQLYPGGSQYYCGNGKWCEDIEAVAAGIVKILNDDLPMLWLGKTRWKLNAAFEAAQGKTDGRYSYRPTFEMLAQLNADACNAAYPEKHVEVESRDNVTEYRDYLKLPTPGIKSYIIPPEWVQWLKLLESYIYNTDGVATEASPILEVLNLLEQNIKDCIFNNLPEYQDAPWTI